MNDESCAGLALPQQKLMCFQYHPEAFPGPHGSDLGNNQFPSSLLIANYKLRPCEIVYLLTSKNNTESLKNNTNINGIFKIYLFLYSLDLNFHKLCSLTIVKKMKKIYHCTFSTFFIMAFYFNFHITMLYLKYSIITMCFKY